MDNVDLVSRFLKDELKKIEAVKRVKGKGLMLGVEFNFPIKEIRSQLIFDYHIFTGSSANPNLLRILPPLGISEQQVLPFVESLKAILDETIHINSRRQ